LPERNPGSLGGDFLAIGLQLAAVMAVPLVLAVYVGGWLDQQAGTKPYLQLVAILVGLGAAAAGAYLVLRRYWVANPTPPVSEEARRAGRRWQAEVDERERQQEAGKEQ
jgi:F0F1-type ATP synthase assembly protein I